MQLLTRNQIEARLGATDDSKLHIDPLLDVNQIGEVTIDLRLGYDFLVSILTRKSFISVNESDEGFRGIDSYFQATRREVGDRFILYPNQIVLSTTLEYIGLPSDVYADVLPRSSYSRLGVHLETMMQPGYRGCFPIELTNLGNNPIELVVGSRLMQARFMQIDGSTSYNAGASPRKYLGSTRPAVSRAYTDNDLQRLTNMERIRNPRTAP